MCAHTYLCLFHSSVLVKHGFCSLSDDVKKRIKTT